MYSLLNLVPLIKVEELEGDQELLYLGLQHPEVILLARHLVIVKEDVGNVLGMRGILVVVLRRRKKTKKRDY